MIHYLLFSKNPSSHYIDVEIIISNITTQQLELQLPAWRPGRYELGNFAKNIKKFEAFDSIGNSLHFTKKSKDLWLIKNGDTSSVKVTYSYFAYDITAGSSFVDDTQLYINPCNLCMYVPSRMQEEHVIELKVPSNYKIACSLTTGYNNQLIAKDFHELADSPLIASASLKTFSFTAHTLPIYIHVQGDCIINEEKVINDFKKFAERQLEFFGGCPVKEYHFLFQVLPHKFYHGVEHLNSTVIAIGPGYNLMKGKTYEDVLGVSCHEMFHLWNIKTIRPAEMLPYNYAKENYARTGYVYEGFTTYYGDLLLLQTKIYSEAQYFESLQERINKHFHNYGRFNLSLADSSFDNWLDGYVPGVPYRKVSIYDEGNLVAFMLDILIMQNTYNEKSLENVMRILYTDFGLKNIGYTEQDIIRIINEVAGKDLTEIFTKFIYGFEPYEEELIKCFDYIGLKMEKQNSLNYFESSLGFKTILQGNYNKVSLVYPESPAYNAGLSINDEIIAVNEKYVKQDLNDWLLFFSESCAEINLTVLNGSQIKKINLSNFEEKFYFQQIKLLKQDALSTNKANNYRLWSKL